MLWKIKVLLDVCEVVVLVLGGVGYSCEIKLMRILMKFLFI